MWIGIDLMPIWYRIHLFCLDAEPEPYSVTDPDLKPVLWIRIRMFLGLQDPNPDPLVRGTDGSGSGCGSLPFLKKVLSQSGLK
jgi:hypothetical protein